MKENRISEVHLLTEIGLSKNANFIPAFSLRKSLCTERVFASRSGDVKLYFRNRWHEIAIAIGRVRDMFRKLILRAEMSIL